MFEEFNSDDQWLMSAMKDLSEREQEEVLKQTRSYGCTAVIVTIVLLILFLLFCSCTTTRTVTVEKVRTDTVWRNHTAHDSIYLHDSTYIREKGDTLMIERWHTQLVKKEVHDTTYIHKTDSVPVPYPVIKEVAKPLSRPQKALMWAGGLSLGFFAVFLLRKLKLNRCW